MATWLRQVGFTVAECSVCEEKYVHGEWSTGYFTKEDDMMKMLRKAGWYIPDGSATTRILCPGCYLRFTAALMDGERKDAGE